jgi:hypothetical protein
VFDRVSERAPGVTAVVETVGSSSHAVRRAYPSGPRSTTVFPHPVRGGTPFAGPSGEG